MTTSCMATSLHDSPFQSAPTTDCINNISIFHRKPLRVNRYARVFFFNTAHFTALCNKEKNPVDKRGLPHSVAFARFSHASRWITALPLLAGLYSFFRSGCTTHTGHWQSPQSGGLLTWYPTSGRRCDYWQ